MKKIIGLLFAGIAILMLGTATANAQVRFGVKGGLNLASVKFSSDVLKTENLTGFQIGPLVEFMVPYVGIGFDAAILYSQKGLYSNTDMRSISSDNLDIPVNFKWKFGLPILKCYLNAGPYVSLRVGGGDLDKLQTQIKSKTFAAGLNFGAGVEIFNSVQVGFNYGLGLTEDYSASRLGDVMNGKSNLMSVTAALLF
ncbi:MAG: PorT family protein [Tannerellaceae bacterium]|jgi:hypothetical protein|nr:PorT family protein [Tannerellaceae bacterium]